MKKVDRLRLNKNKKPCKVGGPGYGKGGGRGNGKGRKSSTRRTSK